VSDQLYTSGLVYSLLRQPSDQPPFVPQLDTSADLEQEVAEDRVAGVDRIAVKGRWLTGSIVVEKVPVVVEGPVRAGEGATPWLAVIKVACTDGIVWEQHVRAQARKPLLEFAKAALQKKVVDLVNARVAYNRRIRHAYALSRAMGVPTPYDTPVDDVVGEPVPRS